MQDKLIRPESAIERSAQLADAHHGLRCDQAAALLFPEFSRSRLKRWILAGQLLVNGRARQPRDRLVVGDSLHLQALIEPEGEWLAQDIAVPLVYEDEDLLVIDKPAGLVVHPAAGHREGTLLNALLYRWPELSGVPRAGIVHRLDKDTSGLMVVARRLSSHTHLVSQLQARSVKRQYLALVAGVPVSGGSVNAPMGRHPVQRKKMAVVSTGGKEAVTHYRVLERFSAHALLRLDLETGRTHQIRVHMAHIGFPLIGDPVYGGRLKLPPGATPELRLGLAGIQRQALHARRLGLVHPATGHAMEWQLEPPRDMLDLLALLRESCP